MIHTINIDEFYTGGKIMNNVKLGFSWSGLIVFLLPMIINIVYVILPPKNAPTTQQETNKILWMT